MTKKYRQATKKEWDKAVNEFLADKITQSKPYQSIHALRTAIEDELQAQKENNLYIHPEAKQAATDLMADLDTAMASWKQSIANALDVKVKDKVVSKEVHTVMHAQTQIAIDKGFIDDCTAAVSAHKNSLMTDPSFWQQVRARINDFMTRWGVGKVLETRGTMFSLNEKIKEKVEIFDENVEIGQKFVQSLQ